MAGVYTSPSFSTTSKPSFPSPTVNRTRYPPVPCNSKRAMADMGRLGRVLRVQTEHHRTELRNVLWLTDLRPWGLFCWGFLVVSEVSKIRKSLLRKLEAFFSGLCGLDGLGFPEIFSQFCICFVCCAGWCDQMVSTYRFLRLIYEEPIFK